MMSFKQLPYLAQIGIVALVIVLLAAGAYFFELQPLEKSNQADALILRSKQAEIAQRVLEEIRQRLGFLYQVGVEYLTLDRLTSTLSGGEAQRIQLATSLGSQL